MRRRSRRGAHRAGADTPWEAQDQVVRAAETAALQIVAELRAGALATGQIQKRFTGYMYGQLALLGQGYRVTGCVPG